MILTLDKIFFLLIFSILFCGLAYSSGMGASPSIARYIFYGEDTLEGGFTVLPREEKNVNIYPSSGDIKDYIFFENGSKEINIHIKGPTFVKFYLNLPKDIKPGKHEAGIVIQQYFTPEEQLSQGMGASAAVMFIVSVRVPNEGKYLEVEMKREPVKINKGDPVYFTINMLNLGTEELNNLKTDILIRGPTQNIVDTITTTELQSLGLGQKGEIRALWRTEEVPVGEYSAESKIEYGGKFPAEVKHEFRVGDIYIEIKNVTTQLEEATAKILIDLRSNWNDAIKDVYAEIAIKKENNITSIIKTSSATLEPWGEATLTAFWERKALEPGEYTLDINVYYYDKQAQRQMRVQLNALEEKAAPAKENQLLLVTIAVILAIILLFNIFWFLLRTRRKPGKKKKK